MSAGSFGSDVDALAPELAVPPVLRRVVPVDPDNTRAGLGIGVIGAFHVREVEAHAGPDAPFVALHAKPGRKSLPPGVSS